MQSEQHDIHVTSRRQFLKMTGLAGMGLTFASFDLFTAGTVAIVTPAGDDIASAAAVSWAAGQLEQALSNKGITVKKYSSLAAVKETGPIIVLAGSGSGTIKELLPAMAAKLPEAAEALALLPVNRGGKQVLLTY